MCTQMIQNSDGTGEKSTIPVAKPPPNKVPEATTVCWPFHNIVTNYLPFNHARGHSDEGRSPKPLAAASWPRSETVGICPLIGFRAYRTDSLPPVTVLRCLPNYRPRAVLGTPEHGSSMKFQPFRASKRGNKTASHTNNGSLGRRHAGVV